MQLTKTDARILLQMLVAISTKSKAHMEIIKKLVECAKGGRNDTL